MRAMQILFLILAIRISGQDVAFKSQGHSLFGTIAHPTSMNSGQAVLLYGISDRDYRITGHRTYAVLSAYLVEQGFTVMRFDHRGFGESQASLPHMSSADFLLDLQAALDTLREQPGVNPKEVVLIAHGQACLWALKHAEDNVDLLALVLLSPSMFSMEAVMSKFRYDWVLQRGFSAERAEKLQAIHAKLADLATGNASEEELFTVALQEARISMDSWLPISAEERIRRREELRKTAQMTAKTYAMPYLRASLQMEPAKLLQSLSLPVLVIYGSDDSITPAAEHSPLVSGPKVSLQVISGLNHNLLGQNEVFAISPSVFLHLRTFLHRHVLRE